MSSNGRSAPSSPSSDRAAIERDLELQELSSRMWERQIARDPRLVRATKVSEDLNTLAAGLSSGRKSSRLKWRALRVLVERFGGAGARRLIAITAEVSDHRLILSLRERQIGERTDPNRERERLKADEDWRLLTEVMRAEQNGLSPLDAIDAALRVLRREWMGREGAKKALTRARKAARQRGYIDPHAPIVHLLVGGPVTEPQLKLDDLRDRGRPAKKGDG